MKAFLKKLNHDGLLIHSLLVMGLLHIGSAANLLFHMAMGRLLSPAEYGVLAALLGAFFIFYTPLFFSIQNTMAHFSRHLSVEGRVNDIRFLAWQWVKKCAAVGFPVLFLVLLCARPLTRVFHLDSSLPVVLIAIILSVSIFIPIFSGAFQGMQRFGWMAASSNGWTLIRLCVAVPLVGWVARTEYALVAHLFSVLICIWIGLRAFCRTIPDPVPTGQPIERVGGYFFGSLFALFFYSILMNADVVMVKIFFPDEAAYGSYAQASVIGRTIVFLSQPIAGALFPKVVAREGLTKKSLSALLRALAISVLLVGGIAGVFSLFPQLPLGILFGEFQPSEESASTVRWVIWAMAPLSLVFLTMNFELAQNRFASLFPMGIFSAVFVIGFSACHPTPVWVAYWLLFASLGALLALVALIVGQGCKSKV